MARVKKVKRAHMCSFFMYKKKPDVLGYRVFKTYVFAGCYLLVSGMASSSDFGTTGLLDIPTARMSADGSFTSTAAIQSRTSSYSITYQAAPWLEGTFRYTGFNNFFRYDRNYGVKLRLWEERRFLPQLAVGARDIIGTAVWGAEYVVASKQIGAFDVTLGMGWGRLAGKGNFSNPMIYLDDSYAKRPKFEGTGGEFSATSFFSGSRVGLFGGMSYKFDKMPASIMMEYNPDQYDFEVSRGAQRPKSPFTVAVRWDALPGASVTLSRQHQDEWGLELTVTLDSKSTPSAPSRNLFRSSLDYLDEELPENINNRSWYDTLLFDVERSGILLLEATIDNQANTATIVMGNTRYSVWADAVANMASLADIHLPPSVKFFNIVVEEEGYRLHSIKLQRPSFGYPREHTLVQREVRIEPINSPKFVQHRTKFASREVIFDINLAARTQLFDPDDPLRYQLYANVDVVVALPGSWLLSGSYGQDISNNFDNSMRADSGSVLPRVRSDVVKYLSEGDSGIDALYLQKRGNLRKDIYYRVFGGILEEMYSGAGGEVLYQPFRSRLAFGVSANWVKKRGYDKSFDHLDYNTTTAHASLYWATPVHNFDVALHGGRYLAKDKGATLEVRRTFNNGWMVGLWATKTNVSAEDFGEGSFDKGMFLKIPINGLLGKSSRGSFRTRVRPIQRDGGQRLPNFSSTIWWDTRAARYDAFSDESRRLAP